MNELKPCPFCGDVLERDYHNDGFVYHRLSEKECILEGKSYRIALWNTRPLEEAPQAELDKYKKAWRNAQNKRVEIFKHYDELKSAIRKAVEEIEEYSDGVEDDKWDGGFTAGCQLCEDILRKHLGDYLPKEDEGWTIN